MNEFLSNFIKTLEKNISDGTCSPNQSFIETLSGELKIGIIAMKDISDILLSIKMILNKEALSDIKTFAFSIDREATEKQKTLWNINTKDFVTVYSWEKNSGWKFSVLEYAEKSNTFSLISEDNSYWNEKMKTDISTLEIDKLLK